MIIHIIVIETSHAAALIIRRLLKKQHREANPLNAVAITLSYTTIEDLRSVEYQWVRSLYAGGYSDQEMNHYIQQCFGGDDTFADLFRQVALSQESLYTLLQHVGMRHIESQ